MTANPRHQTGRVGLAQSLSNVTEDPSKPNCHGRNDTGSASLEGLCQGAHSSEEPVLLRDSGDRIGPSAMGFDGGSLVGSQVRQRTNRSSSFGDGQSKALARWAVCQTLKYPGSWDQQKVSRSAMAQGIPTCRFCSVWHAVWWPHHRPCLTGKKTKVPGTHRLAPKVSKC